MTKIFRKTHCTSIKNTLRAIRRLVHQTSVNLALWHYRKQMRQKIEGHTADYQKYLTVQLRRTLLKRNSLLKIRAQILVDELLAFVDFKQSNVLCIGSRNVMEINYFRSKGAKNVIGIDLYSTDKNIQVMDMHNMTFVDNSFDIIYSSHSLEHSYDIQQVVNEIIRVARPNAHIAIEMPIQFEPTEADLIDIGSAQTLLALFGDHVSKTIWIEEYPPSTPENNSKTSIIRCIFSIS